MRPLLLLALTLALAGCESASSSSAPMSRSSSELLWNEAHGRPQLLSGELHVSALPPEAAARAFLQGRAEELHLDVTGRALELVTTREGLAGTYLRFGQRQRVGGELLPVFEGEVIALVQDLGERRVVRAVNVELRDEARDLVRGADVGPTVATARALLALGVEAPLAAEPVATFGVYVTDPLEKRHRAARLRDPALAAAPLPAREAHLAWRVTVSTEAPPHDWTAYVDAATGEVLHARDGVRFVDGSGYVYDANPVASTGDTSLRDMQNGTSPALEAARFLVTLPRLDTTGFTSGQWADVRPRDAGARAVSATHEFLFTRNDQGFEQANVYYHLDRAQARLQALGFTNVNNRVQGATVNAQNADNSFYSPQSTRLSFGQGGVDDAEDGDIIVHEYGHSIHDDQVPGWGGQDSEAMGEGFGDYLAASFGQALATDAGHPQLGDPACVGDWDGTAYDMSTPPCLRRVDNAKHYPEDAVDQIHDDGELWSAALWSLRGQLGADLVDRLLLESHFLLGMSSSFFTASQALLTADQNVNAGANVDALRRGFIRYGLSRLLSTPAAPGPVTSLPVSLGPVRGANGLYLADTDEVRTLSVPGAAGLQLHFTRVELETHTSCLQQSCDNVYLTNAAGDLFQVVSGVATDVTSVAIAGDTVNVRLVSDPSQQRFGYHVDRVDVLGAPADAGLVYDGGMDVFDAGVPVVDAGRPDAGPPPVDAGPAPVDAGAPATDAGPPPVTGVTTLPAVGQEALTPALNRGCLCGAPGGLDAALALVALATLTRGRRRR